MAERNPKSEILAALKRSKDGRNPKLNRLVSLLLNWFSANARDLPWRRTRDPYAIWVSEIMLQQTQVKTVIPYWQRWMRELPTIRSVAKASPDKIHKLWEGLGYYTRARNLQKAAQQIVANRRAEFHDAQNNGDSQSSSLRKICKFPENFDDILALPGIGRYTAGAICSIAFNQPVPILDGNVIRVLTRIFGIGESPREKKTNARLWRLAEALVNQAKMQSPPIKGGDSALRCPDAAARHPYHNQTNRVSYDSCSHFNQSLMELGALVCTPRNPQCTICPVKMLCVAFRENRMDKLPNLGKRATATPRHFVALVAERNGRFLVRQRPAGIVNAHLWEFPNAEMLNGKFDAKLAAKNALGIEPHGIKPFCTVKHSITRYRITLEAFYVHFGGVSSASPKNLKMGRRGTPPSGAAGVWLAPAQMRRLAFTAAHKKLACFAANRILSG